jgi:hypothetical protein
MKLVLFCMLKGHYCRIGVMFIITSDSVYDEKVPQLCHEHIKVENHWFTSSGCFICMGIY